MAANGNQLLVLGNLCHLYQVYGVVPRNRYIFQSPLMEYNDAIFAQVRRELIEGKAAVVINTRMAGSKERLAEINAILDRYYEHRKGSCYDFFVYRRAK